MTEQDERRRSPRTICEVHVAIKKTGFLGATIDKNADVVDLSSTGLGISLCQELEVGKDYILGFELHWLNSLRYMTVRVINCIAIAENQYRVGVRIMRDEDSTLSFITTAITEQKRAVQDEKDREEEQKNQQ